MTARASGCPGVYPCVYLGEALAAYGFGDGHPFGPDRMHAFWSEALRQGLDKVLTVQAPRLAERAELARFHTSEYINKVEACSALGEGWLDDGDTPAFAGVYDAARCVVGSALDATRRLIEGECHRAMVPIAGLHHARRDAAAGFCVFNDCGVVIESLRAEYGLQRVAYIDIDAHHGDGVFYAFESDPLLFFADTHEDGRHLYPGTGDSHETGRGEAAGSKLNLPLPPGADDAAFFQIWPRIETFLDEARPEFFILQCGADSLAGDPITHLAFSEAAHAHATRALCRLADKHAGGRLLVLGGGGYNRANLARAWCAVAAELAAPLAAS